MSVCGPERGNAPGLTLGNIRVSGLPAPCLPESASANLQAVKPRVRMVWLGLRCGGASVGGLGNSRRLGFAPRLPSLPASEGAERAAGRLPARQTAASMGLAAKSGQNSQEGRFPGTPALARRLEFDSRFLPGEGSLFPFWDRGNCSGGLCVTC